LSIPITLRSMAWPPSLRTSWRESRRFFMILSSGIQDGDEENE
jgi:hypothetical protein